MKTRVEIDELIARWLEDPDWELEESDGFEDHKDELLKARNEDAREYHEFLRWRAEVAARSVLRISETEAEELRAVGLAVAVHNDYKVDGRAHTFWLMTTERTVDEPGGCAVVHAFKGEGTSDMEALDQIWVAWADATGAPRSPVAVAHETEAERQVRRCAEALGYIGEPDRLAVAVGDACLAFAKDLQEINARYMARISKLEESLAVERNKTPINVTAPLAERLRLVRALEILGWPVGQEPELWAEQRAADTRAKCDDLDVELRRAREETAAMRVSWHAEYLELTRAKADLTAIKQRDVQVNNNEALDELMNQLSSARGKVTLLSAERDASADRLRNIMSACFDGSRSGDLAFQLEDMEEWIPKFTSEWKANHRRWLELCDRLGFDALDLAQHGRVAEVDAVAGDAFELRRIRAIVEDDARKRHGDREGEPSWGVIADCVLGHASQHRQAREIMGVPEQFTLDQHVSEISRYLRGFEASRVNIGHWDTHPELPLDLLAREVVAQAERWRIDAEHYRGEASNATAKQVESLSAEVARLTGEVAATQAEAKRQIDRALLERNAAVASRDDANRMDRELIEADEALRSAVSKRFGPVALPRQLPLLLWFIVGYLGATAEAEVTDRLQEQHEPSQVNELKRQVIEQAAEINRLMGRTQMDANQSACSLDSQAMPINPKLGEVDHFPTDSKLLHLRAEAHRTATQLREFAGRSVWPVREALHSAASVVRDLIEAVGEGATALEVPPPTPAVAPEVRCTGCVTVRINKDRVIVKGQTWTSDDPNFKAWDVSLHDDDPRFGFGEPRGPEQRSRVGPTMELGARTGTWTWKGSMGGFGDIKWQGAWTAESKQATDVERLDYSRFPPGYSGETTTEDAWAEWKSKNDPPGFTVYHNGPTWLWQLDAADGAVGEAFEGTAAGAEDARCDAWKWYDRRLAIVSALDAMSKGGYSRANWPRCLTWSRVQVDEVERWLTDPEPFALLPIVLRGGR